MSRSSNTPATPVSNPASAQGVPGGWQLVPIEPTYEMIEAGVYAMGKALSAGKDRASRQTIGYGAMLASSPAPSRDAAVPMSDLKEAVAAAFQRMHADVCYPQASDGEAAWAADEIIAAYLAAAPSPAEAEALPAGVDAELQELRAFKAAAYRLAGKRPNARHHSEPAWNVDLFEVERAALSASAPAPEERADG